MSSRLMWSDSSSQSMEASPNPPPPLPRCRQRPSTRCSHPVRTPMAAGARSAPVSSMQLLLSAQPRRSCRADSPLQNPVSAAAA